MSTFTYVHEARPPFPRIAGPIAVANIDRSYGLSEPSSADLTISVGDLSLAWIQPGMCWSVEQDSIGEPIWAGFVSEMELPFMAESVRVPLIGPKEALLSIEFAVKLPVAVTGGFAVREALLAAQTMDVGMFPGNISQEGAAVELDARGETVSNFIDTVREAVAGADWQERVFFENNMLRFVLDFGLLRQETNITIGPEDIVSGSFTRQRVISSITALSQGVGFEIRTAVSIGAGRNRTAAQPSDGVLHPLSQPSIDLLMTRDIGPAAGRHHIEISERIASKGLAGFVSERHLELLRQTEEVTLTLDATRSNVQRLRLGDVVTLEVPDWALNMKVLAKLHIRSIRPDEPNGRREVVGAVLL